MKRSFIAAIFLTFFISCQDEPKSSSSSSSSSYSLLNGKDLQGWHADIPEMDTNKLAPSPFVIRNGILVSLSAPEGHLISDSVYQDYRLTVEYRYPGKPGNCGVLVHTSTPRKLYKMFPQSLEVQLEHTNAGDFWCIGEDIEVPAMEKRRGPRSEWGSLDGKQRRIPNLTDGTEKPIGEWNTMVIECLDRSIKVWLNDQVVNYGFNCTTNKGRIALQAEGSEVEFRKVELAPIRSMRK